MLLCSLILTCCLLCLIFSDTFVVVMGTDIAFKHEFAIYWAGANYTNVN